MTTTSDSMALGFVCFYVSNVAETVEFWQTAFGFNLQFEHDSGQYSELKTGKTILGFIGDPLAKRSTGRYSRNRADKAPAGAQISLVTRYPKRAYARAVKSGATALSAPHRKPWGQTSGLVRDINGIVVEICTPIEHR